MIGKLDYYTTYSNFMGEGWVRHPTKDDIVEKINEIIDYLNRLDEVEECTSHR